MSYSGGNYRPGDEGDWDDPVPEQQRGYRAPRQPSGYGGMPPAPPGQPPGGRINNYLIPSILATLFCCLPTGIVGIVFASQVNSRIAQGDVAGAQAAAAKARTWTYVSVALGLLVIVVYVLAVINGAGT